MLDAGRGSIVNVSSRAAERAYPSSCIYSSIDTMVNGPTVKVLGWYDNEWGYSNRLVDLVEFIGA